MPVRLPTIGKLLCTDGGDPRTSCAQLGSVSVWVLSIGQLLQGDREATMKNVWIASAATTSPIEPTR
jgi:hypothetical protein